MITQSNAKKVYYKKRYGEIWYEIINIYLYIIGEVRETQIRIPN